MTERHCLHTLHTIHCSRSISLVALRKIGITLKLQLLSMAERSAKPYTQSVRTPGDFLTQVIGKSVVVRLHSGVEYQGLVWLGLGEFAHRHPHCILGRLVCLDGYMNIALEQADEWINGVRHRTYGDAFIRGNNGLSPSPAPPLTLF